MWSSCNVTATENEREKCESLLFERNAWCTRAQLRYFVSHTSLGIGWEAIIQTVCTEYPTRNTMVVRFTAVVTYLSVPPFHIIIVSHIRFYAYDFCRADVGL